MKKIIGKLTLSPSLDYFVKTGVAFGKAKSIVQFYYYIQIFIAYLHVRNVVMFYDRSGFSPIWPTSWTQNFSYMSVVTFIHLFYIIAVVLGAIFYKYKGARGLAFLGILQFHALQSSFGQPYHQMYPVLFTSFLFIFLPDVFKAVKVSNIDTKKFLLVFWGAQAYLLLIYSMSGVLKLLSGDFGPEAFALQVANWLPMIQEKPLLGNLPINYPYFFWPFYLGIIYFQTFAIWAAFRPQLQKIWGLALLSFHFGTLLFMAIVFPENVLLLALFFLNSPFQQSGRARDMLYSFPLFGWLGKRIFA